MQNEPNAPHHQPAPARQPSTTIDPQPSPTALLDPDAAPANREDLNQLFAPQTLQPLALRSEPTLNSALTVVEAQPLPPAVQPHKARRHGRIACLPKPQRDMVNHMLWNGLPYKNIVTALAEKGFAVTERNISNWATGGFLEWRYEQELVLQNRLDQDHLVDHLRRDDASEIPEVGLQAAATRLSQILLQKAERGADLEANLGTFSQMVDVLCRLNREIVILQKQRDDSRRTLGPHHDPARIKEADQAEADEHERIFSDPPAASGLDKPAEPPLLPNMPTSSYLEIQDLEEAARKERDRLKRFFGITESLSGKPKTPTPPALASSSSRT